MTVPARDSAIPVPCRAGACTLPRSYVLGFTMRVLGGLTFWWGAHLGATTCGLLRTYSWTRLRGSYWMMGIPMALSRELCEKRHIEDMLSFLLACGIVVMRLPSTSDN